jgi:carbamoyl-phosphate synthase large subunit
VTKVPRFTFEKFPEADSTLTTQMKSVGETMAIGRTFKESLQKALRGLEVGRFGISCDSKDLWGGAEQPSPEAIRAKLALPNEERVWYLCYAMKSGMEIDEIAEITHIDPWFLAQIYELVALEESLRELGDLDAVQESEMRQAKQAGFSDRQLATIWHSTDEEVRQRRKQMGVVTTFKSVDTCGAEFEAYTPYYYSTYEDEDETPAKQVDQKRVMILGGGPNRIGQGIEFDYCCCHASFALQEMGIESIMVNSNPETVSTDYDTSDLLFFEPLTTEDVLNICDRVQPDGVIVQFGGQTPLNLARALHNLGVPIIGTTVDTIEAAEDREKFQALLRRLRLKQPANGIARTVEQARSEAQKIGYPTLVRPSFVLGGRAMEICYDQMQLEQYVKEAFIAADGQPVLIDSFLEDAIEVDVDCIFDGQTLIVVGIMEHIEEAGVHSGDSACAMPPYSLSDLVIREIREATESMARELNVKGLMNVQFAVKKEDGQQNVYVIEVNPRASRTIPFVAKATGMPVAKVAAKIMASEILDEPLSLLNLGYDCDPVPSHISVKESVFPFRKFAGVDIVLGPEMKSTGEVMGVGTTFSAAFAKGQLAAGVLVPDHGNIFVSVSRRHKDQIVPLARRLSDLGYDLLATQGTAENLRAAGVPVVIVKKLREGHPNLLDYLANEDVHLIMNTPSSKGARTDEGHIRAACVSGGVPCVTTIQGIAAVVLAMEAVRQEGLGVQALQDRLDDKSSRTERSAASGRA